MLSGKYGVFSVFAATINPAGQFQITYRVDEDAAIGERGEVVLSDRDHIYLYLHDNVEYSLACKTSLPGGGGFRCDKAVSVSTIFLQSLSNDDTTHQLSIPDLQHMGELHHKGNLHGILQPSTLLYGRGKGKGYIVVLQQPDEEMILQPPRGRIWYNAVSICCAGEFFIVLEASKQALDVFSIRGNILLLFCHIRVLNYINVLNHYNVYTRYSYTVVGHINGIIILCILFRT